MNRRGILKLFSAIPFAPLVAKDMGDFDFLPPDIPRSNVEVKSQIPQIKQEISEVTGALRWHMNGDYQRMEIYDGTEWKVVNTFRNGVLQ
jgi:hypothetical protein